MRHTQKLSLMLHEYDPGDSASTLSYHYPLQPWLLAQNTNYRAASPQRGGAGNGRGVSHGLAVILTLLFLLPTTLPAQSWTTIPWPADWITDPTAPATEFAVVNFRRNFELETLPDSLPVMVSADNRYQLFVNGQRVGEGPARGDLLHWRYETYDLRPYMKEGRNVVAAIVWNYGIDKPYSQESYRLGFLLQPKTDAFADLKTDGKWLTHHNQAYSPITGAMGRLGTYYVAGPQLRIDGGKMPWGWETQGFDDSSWRSATTITRGSPAAGGTEVYWGLVEREIPLLERRSMIRPQAWWSENKDPYNFAGTYSIGKGKTKRLLIDMQKVSNFFLKIALAGGDDARVKVTYAESLFNEDGTKGQRDATEGKHIRGVYDIITPFDETADVNRGNTTFNYETLWFRTARFVELELAAGEKENLTIVHINTEEFAYPFKEVASFTDSTNTHRTDQIWDVGWQTARMCAQETYVDCPYYEQLQYVGDTRIQALISLYVSGDDRLMRKAIKIFDQSRMTEGLTQSRYPSNVPQLIPPYSLSWIEMVGDYWMHRPDTAFVRARLEGVESVLAWYDQQLLPNGMIGRTPYWNFVDWTDEWSWDNVRREGGVPSVAGGSSILSLQYVSALRTAAKLFAYFGNQSRANAYSYQADGIAEAVTKHCWNAKRGLFSDTPKGKSFSQHANILALLTDLAPASAPNIMLSGGGGIPAYRNALLSKVLTDESLTQVSEYFRFYLIQALYHTGRADLYVDQLKIWEAYLDQGFTTFPEKPGESRSDCHAWSASPNYDLLATLGGIRPSSPGFKTVSVRPAKDGIEAKVPHPNGLITLRVSKLHTRGLEYPDMVWTYTVTLPKGVTGTLEFGSSKHPLKEGVNTLEYVMDWW